MKASPDELIATLREELAALLVLPSPSVGKTLDVSLRCQRPNRDNQEHARKCRLGARREVREMIRSPSHPKTMRKSRRARLPIASTNSEMKFEPTEAHWVDMDSAYGFKLDADDREEIVRLVTSYFLFEPFERSAPFVDEAKKWLAKAQAAGEAFYAVVSPAAPLSEAAHYGYIRISQSLKKWPHLHVSNMGDLTNAMICFLAAAELVSKDLKDDRGNGHVEGAQWGGLIRGLTKWFKDKRYPVGASKGKNKSNSGKPSSFVAFVCALQRTFPLECQRHMTDDGLATAICNARKSTARGSLSR